MSDDISDELAGYNMNLYCPALDFTLRIIRSHIGQKEEKQLKSLHVNSLKGITLLDFYRAKLKDSNGKRPLWLSEMLEAIREMKDWPDEDKRKYCHYKDWEIRIYSLEDVTDEQD